MLTPHLVGPCRDGARELDAQPRDEAAVELVPSKPQHPAGGARGRAAEQTDGDVWEATGSASDDEEGRVSLVFYLAYTVIELCVHIIGCCRPLCKPCAIKLM